MNVRNFMHISAMLLLVGCSGGGGSSAPDNTSGNGGNTASPGRIIDNEDLTAGLQGVDANNNGIRDDIDRLIAQKYSATPAMKRAVEQDARALQSVLSVTNKVQARVAGNAVGRAGDCIYKVFPHATSSDSKFREQESKEIEALTANTKERFTAYMNGNNLMGGMVFSQAEEPVCD